jgi:hypothetical protein
VSSSWDQQDGYEGLRGEPVLKRGSSKLVDPIKREKEQSPQ